MAISHYGPNRNKTIINYSIIALIIIVAVVFYFYLGKKKKAIENTAPAAQTTQPAASQQAAQTTKPGKTGLAVTDTNSAVTPHVAELLKQAQNDADSGKIIVARNSYNDILNMSPLPDSIRGMVKTQMTALADQWLFTKTIQLGDDLCSSYKVQPGDSLAQIGAKCKVPYQFLMKINNITSDKGLRADQVIKVAQGPFHAIVYKSAFTMDLYLQNVFVKSYRIGTGKEGRETPVGLWRAKVGGKMIKPTWTDPDTGKTYHAEDPDYPLGSGWISLEGTDSRTRGIEGIAIHGTNDESTIGTKSSRGCIRLYNGELMDVYNMFEAGFSELRVVE
jgi:lipoprotein-anchoring transpeptidase ErfK/SrfK